MKILHPGNAGLEVQTLCQLLRLHGFWNGIDLDIYANNIVLAVEQFQQANDLVDDGIVGPRTWTALLAGHEHEIDLNPAVAALRGELKALLAPELDPRRKVVLLEAFRWLGVAEDPDGSNTGPKLRELVDGYSETWGIRPVVHPPWCAIAVSQWIRKGLHIDDWAKTPFGAWFGGVSQIRNWGEKNKRLFPFDAGVNSLMPGDVFVMGRQGSASDAAATTAAGHCGLVVADLGDRVRTVEGNVGNRVQSRVREKKHLLGFVVWA